MKKIENSFKSDKSSLSMRLICLLILLCLGYAHKRLEAMEDQTQIAVRLATESQLMPLYLGKFVLQEPGFDTQYIHKLEKVLNFDLNHNGMTYLVNQSDDKEALLKGSSSEEMGYSSDWQTINVYYVVKVQIKEHKLSAHLLAVNQQSKKFVEGLTLTGNLSQDRRKVHQLADAIHKSLFGTEGIATTRFLYTVKNKDSSGKWSSEVWEADYDGENARQITRDSGYSVTPVYIPPKPGYSSGNFFYVSYKNGQPKIYIASLKEGVGRRFSMLLGNQLMPAISQQRDKVAFICDYTGNPDLFLQGFSSTDGLIGKPQQIFSTHQATQGTPTFNPKGDHLAFVSNKDGSPRIYTIEIPAPGASFKDVKAKLVSKKNKENSAPAWSPDGTKLAYCSSTEGIRQIWIYDFAKNQERQVTQGPGNKENPTWAPNSLHLIFNSTGQGQSELYLINLNQPHSEKISSGAGEKRFPSWEPLSKP